MRCKHLEWFGIFHGEAFLRCVGASPPFKAAGWLVGFAEPPRSAKIAQQFVFRARPKRMTTTKKRLIHKGPLFILSISGRSLSYLPAEILPCWHSRVIANVIRSA